MIIQMQNTARLTPDIKTEAKTTEKTVCKRLTSHTLLNSTKI